MCFKNMVPPLSELILLGWPVPGPLQLQLRPLFRYSYPTRPRDTPDRNCTDAQAFIPPLGMAMDRCCTKLDTDRQESETMMAAVLQN